MTELLTAAQMRAIEAAAIESGTVTGLELMERAGQGVVEAILEEWPEMAMTSQRAVVLCGPGNNGGDGFVVARLLHQRGWEVEVYLYGDAKKLPADARINFERWLEFGSVEAISTTSDLTANDLIVDAVFGTGLSRVLPSDLTALGEKYLDDFNSCSRTEEPSIVAIDVPSGVCADSGRILGSAIFEHTDICVTFHKPKLGLFLTEDPGAIGTVYCKPIGLQEEWTAQTYKQRTQKVGRLVNFAKVKRRGNKFDSGHAVVLSGGSGNTGAARLAARGALRIGSGLVTVGCPPSAKLECAMQLTAIMLKSLKDEVGLAGLLEDERLNALCLGPGMGLNDRTRAMVATALASRRACVLDADALTVFKDAPEQLFNMLHTKCVLTPHGGEFKRLFPDIQAKLDAPAVKGPAYSKVDATQEAAKRAGCTVLYKGADTVIADERGAASINSSQYERAAPWLATAGSGDVLAGFITGLLARGFSAKAAAETGAWLHTECALSFGPGLIAEDLPEELPKVFRALEV